MNSTERMRAEYEQQLKPNVYEREIQHWKSLAEMLMKERELKAEPIHICAVCAKKIGLTEEVGDEKQ